jgi:hypothetical protein
MALSGEEKRLVNILLVSCLRRCCDKVFLPVSAGSSCCLQKFSVSAPFFSPPGSLFFCFPPEPRTLFSSFGGSVLLKESFEPSHTDSFQKIILFCKKALSPLVSLYEPIVTWR